MAAPVQRQGTHLQVPGPGGKHSLPECQQRRRAHTLSLPPPGIVEQPQACSISRSFMAAPLQRHTPSCRCLVLAAITLNSSANGRDERTPRVRRRLTLWSSRKHFARSRLWRW